MRRRNWLLVALLCLAGGCREQEDKDLQAALSQINFLGGTVERDEERPGRPIVIVDCDHKKVGNEVLAGLKNSKELKVLKLAGSRINDDGLKYLVGLTHLQTLNLRDTNVTDKGLTYLEDLTSLQYLGLSGTQVTDDGLAYLKHLTNLQTLYLNSTPVSDEGAKKLQDELPQTRIVH